MTCSYRVFAKRLGIPSPVAMRGAGKGIFYEHCRNYTRAAFYLETAQVWIRRTMPDLAITDGLPLFKAGFVARRVRLKLRASLRCRVDGGPLWHVVARAFYDRDQMLERAVSHTATWRALGKDRTIYHEPPYSRDGTVVPYAIRIDADLIVYDPKKATAQTLKGLYRQAEEADRFLFLASV